MTSTSTPVLVVLGVGPGLGLSIAQRFGASGHRVALISRSPARHSDYLAALSAKNVEAAAYVADAHDHDQLTRTLDEVRERFGRIDVGYYGAASLDVAMGDITELDATSARTALNSVVPVVDFAGQLLPEMRERGSGGLLFAGGLSSVVPMPSLGGLALASAALRNYAVTLHAALQPAGIYAGTITIGGLIERGDIYRAMAGNGDLPTINPDELAELAWGLYRDGTEAEAVINLLF
ncbi:SDR family NAD(P)-dependent oxidoreductase [Mycolicibacterium fortuitum]|uniref:SDR family NAD(P)-dependent oxidoreductase n=1 Tax=Mycolicibacterium TaxID=1866885 RepID=UPI0007EE1D96|nr:MULTISPECIES: SDR family NAD(P)-dependent oxidoreductase [Mycolicibacterium]NOP94349.1 SDR family NAD(P)-dependent oxidoreductase [Mycolicibacterium fortuitum]OBI60684.1 short-chain dehydrogenase [Mycolicibacterium fortuitum]OBK05518.1 short-chain dehydrogenase [Mycolicibacterium fortuitum]